MTLRKAACATVLVLWPCASLAHGMGNVVGYQLTVQSMLDSVSSPVVLLLLLGFAFLAGTSGQEQARRAAGCFGAGLVAGFAAAPWLGPYGAVCGLVIGGLCSLLSAASLAAMPVPVLNGLGLAAGLSASVWNLDGHPLGSLPLAAYLGVVLGPLILGVSVMSWIGILLDAVPKAWVRIMFRIFSSWGCAANAIYLAFQVKLGG